jgi:hypothetical protein
MTQESWMPYKDKEKRRIYQGKYKRRQRAKARMSNPLCPTMSIPMKACQTSIQTVKRKASMCPKDSHHRISGIIGKNGYFFTDQAEEQERIESDPLYGGDIFNSMLEP